MNDYPTKRIVLVSDVQRYTAKSLIDNAPNNIEVILREVSKKRTSEQNGYLWSGMMGDFVKQGWLNGRQYPVELWHDYLKRLYLPEQPEQGITLKGYRKWDIGINDNMILTGSTKQLTTKGFSDYITECCAYGAGELGIMFTTKIR